MVIPPPSRRGRLIAAQERLRSRLSGRGPLIAGQAAIVAVLIALAYGTFLQDNDPGPLSGIDAPGPQGQLDDDRKNGGDGAGGNGGPGGGAGGGSTAGAGAGAGGGGAGSGSASFADTTPPGRTPTDSQYSDTLALLKEQLGSGATLSDGGARRP